MGDKEAAMNGKSPMESNTDGKINIGYSNEAYELNEITATEKPATVADSDKSKEKNEEKPPVVSVRQLFRFATKLDVLLISLGTLCAIVHGSAMQLLIIVLGEMIDSFIDNEKLAARNTTNLTPISDEIKTFALYYVYIAIGVIVFAYGQVTFWLMASNRQTHRIRSALFRSIAKQEVGWFDTRNTGELNNRLVDDVNKIQDGIGDKVSAFFQLMTTFIVGFIIGLVYGWKLCLVILSVSPLLVASGIFMTYTMTGMAKQELDAYAKAGAIAEEVLGAIRTVVAFGGEKKECDRYSSELQDAKKFGKRKSFYSGIGIGLIFFIMFSIDGLAFWYGAKLVHEEDYTPGQMIIVFFVILMGAFSLGSAAPNLQNFATARGAAYTIWQTIDRKSEIDSSSTDGEQPNSMEGRIELKDVVFSYPSRPDVPVLCSLSLSIKPGLTVALVGGSGCGKSTVIQLLQRFYDPLDGAICIDGQDIRSLNIAWLRRHLGIVSQEPVLFATSINENIRYGREGVTQSEIEQAAIAANAHDFISQLPDKYETLVGERGAQLSGGQKQRIAIARALIRDPKILLLDEATSALDTESEATVQAALDKARLGRTTIIVAHRLSTIRTADIIIGLKDGVVHEQGTHDELMEKHGLYYELVTNQIMYEEEDDVEDEEESKFDITTSEVALNRANSLDGVRSSGRKKAGLQRVMSVDTAKSEKDKEEKLPEVSMLRILKLNSPEWPYIVVGCICALILGAENPSFAIVFSELLAVFTETDEDEKQRKINLYCLMFVIIGIVTGICMFLMTYMFGHSAENLTERIRHLTFKAFLHQEIAFFDKSTNTTGALTTRLSTDAAAIHGASGVRIGTFLQGGGSVIAGISIGFAYSWELTLAILAFVPLLMVAGMLQMKTAMGSEQGGGSAIEEAGKTATEVLENIRTVAALTKEEHFANYYEQQTSKPFKDRMRKSHLIGLSFSFTQSLMYLVYAVAFYFGAWLHDNRDLSFGDMFKVFAGIVFGAMAVGQASGFAPDYAKAKVAAQQIIALLDWKPSINSASTEGLQPGKTDGSLEFKNVRFRYPSRQTVPVLRGFNLKVEPGQTVALVGSSGCGKSTTVQILERFYDPWNGSVLFDQVELPSLNIGWLRRQIGIVFQEPMLFDCSIRDNIAYGDTTRDVHMDEVIAAARDANIHNFIESLPDGYDTNVGNKGTQLSGGQKQRVAIARALVRNPKVLLLDEATSALDTESEKVVQEALDRAQVGRTSIVIAHRLSTIQNADRIIVIHNGVVAESGTHTELLALKGRYYQLSGAQAAS